MLTLCRSSRGPYTDQRSDRMTEQCQHVRAVSPARVVDTLGNVGPLALSQIRETIAVIVDLP